MLPQHTTGRSGETRGDVAGSLLWLSRVRSEVENKRRWLLGLKFWQPHLMVDMWVQSENMNFGQNRTVYTSIFSIKIYANLVIEKHTYSSHTTPTE